MACLLTDKYFNKNRILKFISQSDIYLDITHRLHISMTSLEYCRQCLATYNRHIRTQDCAPLKKLKSIQKSWFSAQTKSCAFVVLGDLDSMPSKAFQSCSSSSSLAFNPHLQFAIFIMSQSRCSEPIVNHAADRCTRNHLSTCSTSQRCKNALCTRILRNKN